MRPFAKPCGAPAEFRYEQVGVPKKLFGFTAILSYSRMRYVTFVKRCDAPTLIRCLMEAFEYFEGLPKAALTDRMKTVLLSMDGNLPIWLPRFADAHGLYRGLPTGVQALHASDQRGCTVWRENRVQGSFDPVPTGSHYWWSSPDDQRGPVVTSQGADAPRVNGDYTKMALIDVPSFLPCKMMNLVNSFVEYAISLEASRMLYFFKRNIVIQGFRAVICFFTTIQVDHT